MSVEKVVNRTLIVFRVMFGLFHHLYCYSSVFIWILLLWPLKSLRPKLFWRLYQLLCELLVTMGSWYSWSAGYGVVEMGDDITPCLRERTLVLLNHQSAGDIIVLWNILVARPEMIKRSLWIMNEEFQYTPFGIISVIRKDFFIPIGKDVRVQGLSRFKDHLVRWFIPLRKKMIILFPEGGFLYKRRAKSQKYALEHNLPVLQNVCLPRIGAVQTILDVCPPCTSMSDDEKRNENETSSDELKWILDVTIAYPEGEPLSLSNICFATRKPFNTRVVYRLFPATEVPRDTDLVTDWLYSRWQEKEEILSTFYTSGEIPVDKICSNPIPSRVLLQNPLKHLFIHLFFLLSFLGFFKIICLLVSPKILVEFLVFYLILLTLKVTKVI